MKKNSGPDAITLLEEQHREVEDLFSKLEDAQATGEKARLFASVADKLAIHATIEERHFYPAVKAKQTEDLLREAVEEHLSVKRVIADILQTAATDTSFDAKIKVLQEQVEHHVEEEEDELFPAVRKLFNKDELSGLANDMLATQATLEGNNPRNQVPDEIAHAATLGG